MTVTPEMIEIAEEKLFGNAKRMARRMGAEFVLNEQGHELVRQKAIDDMSQASPPPQTEDQWQTHTGGGCPVHGDSTVEFRTRGGSLATMRANAVVWDYGSTIWEIPGPLPPECQIIEYRVVAPPQEEVLLNDIGMMMSEFVDNWPEPKKIKTALALIAKTMRAALNPPKHIFWGAGEPDCPREIKAGNGELHTLRCKVCDEDNPRDDRCRAALTAMKGTGDA